MTSAENEVGHPSGSRHDLAGEIIGEADPSRRP